jgi:NAD+ synthase (glutamine-hydrolysing)
VRLIKIGLGSVNSTVGAFSENVDRCIAQARSMAEEGVTVGLFPEQVIGGYPPEDLIQWQGFVDHQWQALERFSAGTAELQSVFVLGVAVVQQGLRYNCAAVVSGGQIDGLVPKEKLPTYSIYYEGRTVAHGSAGVEDEHRGVPFGDFIFRYDFGTIAVEVCEDLWSPDGPMKRRTYAGAELVCNVSSSVYRVGILQTRRELIATRAADHQCTIAYVNMVGANDGLIFDGGGFVNQNGKNIVESPRFTEGFGTAVVDLDRTLRLRSENTTWRVDREDFAAANDLPSTIEIPAGSFDTSAQRNALNYPVPDNRSFFLPPAGRPVSPREELFEEILDALALGIGDYFEKTGAFKLIGISLSGGRDSLLTLLIAHRYASRKHPDDPGALLRAFYQPSRYSSDETRLGAITICTDLGVPLEIVSIDDAYERELATVGKFLGSDQTVTELTKQNIQARLRAQRMWNWSNSSGGLFLQTGNMTEKAVGYTTVGGDLMGALAVLANVPKTVVMALLDYLYEKHGYPGIKAVLAKPAGPELAANQSGEAELMPFPILDACFYLFAGEKLIPDEVREALRVMFPEVPGVQIDAYVEKFVRLFLQSIYKWVQSPLSLHIGNLDLERERALQLPVVTKSDWTRPLGR